MKKAFQISIAQTLFSVEEDAYAALETYLASIKRHFEGTEGEDDIIADIESRIAEKLLEAKERVVTLASVERIIASMGRVEDFGEEGAKQAPESDTAASGKKLYRNPDDMLIAGVCSGLAAYFGLDTLWVRIGFVVLTIISGFGVALYLLLWLLMPLAKTGAQKLEMSGQPVTLETIRQAVNERIEEIKTDERRGLGKLIALPFELAGKILRPLVSSIGPILRAMVAVVLCGGSVIALVAIATAVGFFSSNETWLTDDISMSTLLPGPLHLIVIASFALALTIPLLLMLGAGLNLIRRKAVISSPVGFSLLGLWLLALVGSGFSIASIATRYHAYVANDPAYQEITREIPLDGAVAALTVTDGLRVTIAAGTSTAMTVTGREKEIAMVQAHVKDGTLVVERNYPTLPSRFCLFCSLYDPEITVTLPAVAELRGDHGATLKSEMLPAAASLTLTLEHGSYADLSLDADDIRLSLEHGSAADLEGSSAALSATLEHGSYLDAADLKTVNADLSLEHDSSAQVAASGTLTVDADHGSSLRYSGTPTLSQHVDHGSSLIAVDNEEE